MLKIKSVGVIGVGKLGESLAVALWQSKKLNWLFIRNETRKEEIQSKYDFNRNSPNIIQNFDDIDNSFDCIFITVNDTSINQVLNKLTNTKLDFQDKFIVHCSGIESVEILSPLEKKGAITLSAHPFQTFFIPSEDMFKGIYWGVETSSKIEIINPFIDLIESFGSKYQLLNFSSMEERASYHLSAVLSSNFISLILFHANETIKKSGIDKIEILEPIVKTTINNFFTIQANKFPITGPAVRADSSTINKHLEALKDNNNLKSLYKAITISIAQTGNKLGLISENKVKDIMNLLDLEI